jgi:glyoxylase I family protein
MATITGAHHIAFTVRNAEASAQWYQDLLGMQVLIAHEDDTVKLRVLAHPDSGWIIGIRQYVGREEAEFTEFRTGLDHFAFTVGSRDDLTQWEAELSRRGIPFTPTADTPIGTVVVFRDPDNIQLEFWLPIGQ